MPNFQIEEMDKANEARKAYAALDFFNDSPCNSADSKNYNEAQKHLDNLYAIVKAYEGKTETQEKPKPTRYIMTIRFRTIPKMGDSSASQYRYFSELAERHNVASVDVIGTNDAEVYYYDRKNADALLDELYKDNAGPYINCAD